MSRHMELASAEVMPGLAATHAAVSKIADELFAGANPLGELVRIGEILLKGGPLA